MRKPLLLAILLAGCAPASPGPPPATVSGAVIPAGAPLPFAEPALLTNRASAPNTVEVDVTAQTSRLTLQPGKQTEMLTYNGTFPGPTLDVREGDRVIVHFKNDLTEPSNLHWHGLPVPPSEDGLPMDVVAPGGTRDYTFTIPKGAAGTYWYHPHTHGQTALQVAKGLVGAVRVRADDDPLPAAFGDTVAVLWDNRFDESGAIAPFTNMDRMDGRQGNVVFVNGQVAPTLALKPGEIRRMRFINASASRYYMLNLPGHTLMQVGTDGGLLAAPVEREAIALAPSERVEVLVQADTEANEETQLQSLPIDRGAMAMPVGTAEAGHSEGGEAAFPLLHLATSSEATPTMPAIPGLLRPLPALALEGATARTLTFTEDMLTLDFRINGQQFDHNRIDIRSTVGATEIWTLQNQADMDHPFHLHGYQFQVLDRNGIPEPFRAWKDTVNVRKREVVRFAVKFDGPPGLRVYHCHILNHEDLGMMGTLQVDPLPPTQPETEITP